MISQKMYELGSNRSVIREIFEYAKQRAAVIGAENVFDFSLGNPSVPAPESVREAIIELLQSMDATVLHGYTSAQGDAGVRSDIAKYISDSFDADVCADDIYMTCGAAASLCACIKAVACEGDEFVIFAPFFPEYRVFIEAAGGKAAVVPPREPDLQIDLDCFEKSINADTKAVIVNSPNNPSGVVYSKETISAMCKILREKQLSFGHPIYLIADEPYRELVFDGAQVPYLINCYDNTFVCYSFSKSLSLPGERIGYVVVSPKMEEHGKVYAAVCGAGRALGYVCAPSLMQRVAAKCLGQTSDISVYKRNRDILCGALGEYGYSVAKPDGAFYLFVRALEPNAAAFCEEAKKHELLLVPSDSFGCPGYVRVAYCVSTDMIERSLPAFKKLAEEYGAR
ncbi:MAG: pyridoxal phosphate-dependent aminotransferase [Oscillospiraceae bacterium]